MSEFKATVEEQLQQAREFARIQKERADRLQVELGRARDLVASYRYTEGALRRDLEETQKKLGAWECVAHGALGFIGRKLECGEVKQ